MATPEPAQQVYVEPLDLIFRGVGGTTFWISSDECDLTHMSQRNRALLRAQCQLVVKRLDEIDAKPRPTGFGQNGGKA